MKGDLHVIPLCDRIEHVEARACWCRPALEECDINDAPAVVVHHAADGREYFEIGHEPLEEIQ